MSVDVSKAFDSVDHRYMEKVYQFYGLGPRIRKWLALILLANNELSLAFQLEKDHTQGDAPSPLVYNMTAQICIWKVELDPEIISVYDPSLCTNPDANRPGAPDRQKFLATNPTEKQIKMNLSLTMPTTLRYLVTVHWHALKQS